MWPLVSRLIKAAVKRTGLCSFKDIESAVLAGKSLVWMAWTGRSVEAAATTELIETEAGKVCVITTCAGNDMRRWLPLVEGIEQYARNERCKLVRIYGRKGWLSVLDGYREKHVIMDKDVC